MTTIPVPLCKLCALGAFEMPESLSQRELSEMYDVSKSSVQRHVLHLREASNLDDRQVKAEGSLSESLGVPLSSVSSRTVSTWGNGRSERITYQPARIEANKVLLDTSDIQSLLDSLDGTADCVQDSHNDHSMIVCVSDLQIGKTDLLGGTPELLERLSISLAKISERAQEELPGTIVLADLGDIIENFNNTVSQRETNDLDLTTQIRTARQILVRIIKTLAKLTPRLLVVSVPSNHCSVRVGMGSNQASTPNNDFGIDLNHSLELIFDDRAGFEHVEFIRPVNEFTETVTIDLGDAGGYVGFVHGHQAKKQENIKNWLSGQTNGQRNGMHLVRTLFYGHFHNPKMEQSGNERWIFGTPTSDAGSSWYSNLTGESSTNGIMVINLVDNGRWFNMEIL